MKELELIPNLFGCNTARKMPKHALVNTLTEKANSLIVFPTPHNFYCILYCGCRLSFGAINNVHELAAKKYGTHLELPDAEVGSLETGDPSKITAIVGHDNGEKTKNERED